MTVTASIDPTNQIAHQALSRNDSHRWNKRTRAQVPFSTKLITLDHTGAKYKLFLSTRVQQLQRNQHFEHRDVPGITRNRPRGPGPPPYGARVTSGLVSPTDPSTGLYELFFLRFRCVPPPTMWRGRCCLGQGDWAEKRAH